VSKIITKKGQVIDLSFFIMRFSVGKDYLHVAGGTGGD